MPTQFQDQSATPFYRRAHVAYLLSRYPAISHTFFLKEVLGLRQRGIEVSVASINPPDRPRSVLPDIEAAEADHTFYVKPSGFAKVAVQVLVIALSNPAATLRGVRASWRLGGWDLKARAYAVFYLAEALLVGDWMRRKSLTHLHVHFGGPVATVGMLASQAWQLPWSVTLHGPDEFFDQDAFYLRQKINSAAFVVCISDFCRSQVLRIAADLDQGHLETLRLGVDCTALQPSQRNHVVPDLGHPVKIVCTGRMVTAKGHRILLESIAALVLPGVNVSCTLIGDGPERKALEAQCSRLGIERNVEFLGALAHQPTLEQVARADIFVLASFAEGLPVALMEAMALGVPCVSTTIAAIPELIHQKENGMLVPAANVPALTAALALLVEDATLRQELGRRARTTVELEYNLATNLDLLAEMWVRRLAPATDQSLG